MPSIHSIPTIELLGFGEQIFQLDFNIWTVNEAQLHNFRRAVENLQMAACFLCVDKNRFE
jgi:hypothetical protein